ncbi:glycosyltransferase [candidate division KSB1 bacterium]|nr:glycosyltransferase [candidate division KSB1 bacterium]
MKKKTVAIYQNTIGGGGRIKVIAAMTYVFNQMGIVPDWISFRNTIHRLKLDQIINKSIAASPRILRQKYRGLSEVKYLMMNKAVAKLSNEYDLVINSNNTMAGLSSYPSFLHYIHFPREARLLTQYHNYTINSKLLKLIFRKMYAMNYNGKQIQGKIFANSNFTRQAILDGCGVDSSSIQLLYPPVVRPVIAKLDIGKDRKKVVSLGRFSPHKNQLVQLQIAKQVPGIQFDIIGFVGNRKAKKYYDLCNNYILKNGLKNVYLHKNISYQKVLEYLGKANIFIHSMSDEPFGIATVEAMFFNCIPLVHCSGGQKEIVKEAKFMFTTIDEAVNKLLDVLSLSDLEYKSILESLSSRAELYSLDAFLDKFALIIDEYIDRQGSTE